MIFAYGRIILEICRVFKERSKMTRDAISAQSKKPSGLTPDRKKSTCVINGKYSEDGEAAAKRLVLNSKKVKCFNMSILLLHLCT